MGLRQLIDNLGRLSRQTALTPDQIPGFMAGSPVPAGLRPIGLARPAESVTMVYGCVVARREAVAAVPLRVTDAQDNVIETGPVVELLSRPNQAETFEQLIRKMETYMALYDAVALAVVDEGAPEILAINPARLEAQWAVHGPTGTPVATGWIYRDTTTGRQVTFKPEQLVLRQGFNPYAPLKGLAPLTALEQTIAGELAARQQNLALFANDGRPSAVITAPGRITVEQANELKAKWEDLYKGFSKRGQVGVLWGDAKIQELGLTPAEMEYLAGLKFLRTDYYMVFRVCPAMVNDMMGETGLSQGSSTDEQKVRWWEDVGLAELSILAGTLQDALQRLRLPGRADARTRALSRLGRATAARARAKAPAAGWWLWFDDGVIPALVRSRLAKIDQLAKVAGMGWRPDEVADWLDLGLPPHADNKARVAFSLAVIGEDDDLATKGTKDTETLVEEAAKDEERWGRLEGMIRGLGERAGKSAAKKRQFDAFLGAQTKLAAGRWNRFFVEQRGRVLERLGAGRMAHGAEGRSVREDADAMLGRLMPGEEDGMLWARIGPVVTEQFKAGWDYFNQETGTDAKANPFQVDNPFIQQAISERQIKCTMVNRTTENDLRKIIAESIEAGQSTAELGDAIAQYYRDNLGKTAGRPQVAAQVQTSGVVNESRMLAARQVGGLLKTWIHGSPDEAREGHVAAEAKYGETPIPLEEKFEILGGDGNIYLCDQPGDASLPVGELAGCTCMVGFAKAKE